MLLGVLSDNNIMYKKTCLQCNKEFTKPYNRSIRDWNERAKYCSLDCKRICCIPTNNNKGKHLSAETKQKISLALKGRKLTYIPIKGRIPWNKGTVGLLKMPKGKNSPHWKGGQDKNKLIRMSTEYKSWRTAVFTRDEYTCKECNVKGGVLHAHHIKSFALFPELRFAINNGVTLCVKCHVKTESWGNRKLLQMVKISVV